MKPKAEFTLKATIPLAEAVSRFGAALRSKLSAKGAVGAPEDQLRAPLELLVTDLSELLLFKPGEVIPVGETTLSSLKTRPDYAVTVKNALVGFIEVKAPGKGADPRRFKDEHDKEQWEKLKSLPNLIYTDGNAFRLWRDGELAGRGRPAGGRCRNCRGETCSPAGSATSLRGFPALGAHSAHQRPRACRGERRLCRLLRDEVTEQLELGSLGADRPRQRLAEAALPRSDRRAVRRRLRAGRDLRPADGANARHPAERRPGPGREGAGEDQLAHRRRPPLLTDDVDEPGSAEDLARHADARARRGRLGAISKGDPDAWLYFYEDFLEVYDNALRKQTGSYYTPPEVVAAMVRLVDDALRDASRFGVPAGLASADVTLADPAVGTGTFLLGVLRQIAAATRQTRAPAPCRA